jgi:hypothetical protein
MMILPCRDSRPLFPIRLHPIFTAAVADRRIVVAEIGKPGGRVEGIYRNHGYTLWGYDSATQTVTLRNPHGYGGEWKQQPNRLPPDGRDDGIFEMPLADFVRVFAIVTIEQ